MRSRLDSYNVTWTSPAQTDRGSMPLGNGEVGINVWVLANGAIEFYLARTDARTELDRSVKLGKVRVSFSPDAGLTGSAFRQTLILAEGCVEIRYGDGAEAGVVHVFVDADHPTVFVTGRFTHPVTVAAEVMNWRTGPRLHPPSGACETPDILEGLDGGVLFYHRNGPTIIPFLAKLEAVEQLGSAIPDCLSDRIFGGLMRLEGSVVSQPARLVTPGPVRAFNLQVTTDSEQLPDLESWKARMSKLAAEAAPPPGAQARTARWWIEYWEQSWLFLEGDRAVQPEIDASLFELHLEPQDGVRAPVPGSAVTRAYILTRFMFACMSRGAFPILYSGGLFNGMPGDSGRLEVLTFSRPFTAQPDSQPNLVCNPDERAWGHFYLWQNTRLPYHSMLARGETGWLRGLFDFYRRFRDLDRGRAALYYGAEGQFNTEIAHSFGLQPDWVYGLDRQGKPDGYSENRWGGAVDISPGLELLHLMLDFYDYQQDDGFLRDALLPYAHDLLRFIETRFPEREDGKMLLRSIQSVETYWDTTDALPIVAGIAAVVRRILALPGQKVMNREFYCRIEKLMPDLPVEDAGNVEVLAPARVYERERKNCEAPEFYAIFPFRLFGPGMKLAIDTYHHASAVAGSSRPFVLGRSPEYPSYSGWQQHGMVAALLGLAEEARTILEHNCALTNPGYRFPAMWGPIYDAVPDIDHGANILTTLQLMAFQVDGDQIRILPAWPKDWDVSFKLHAPRNTTVECTYRRGKIEKLEVTPASRRNNVRFPAWCRVAE